MENKYRAINPLLCSNSSSQDSFELLSIINSKVLANKANTVDSAKVNKFLLLFRLPIRLTTNPFTKMHLLSTINLYYKILITPQYLLIQLQPTQAIYSHINHTTGTQINILLRRIMHILFHSKQIITV